MNFHILLFYALLVFISRHEENIKLSPGKRRFSDTKALFSMTYAVVYVHLYFQALHGTSKFHRLLIVLNLVMNLHSLKFIFIINYIHLIPFICFISSFEYVVYAFWRANLDSNAHLLHLQNFWNWFILSKIHIIELILIVVFWFTNFPDFKCWPTFYRIQVKILLECEFHLIDELTRNMYF